MKNIVVDKEQLLVALKSNRDEHEAIFIDAQKGYRAKVIQELDKMLQAARDGGPIKTYVQLDAPTNQTEDYNRAIQMLQWSVDDKHELTELEFNQFVLNVWSWSGLCDTTNAAYTTMSKR